jgi:hypothetical protein
MKTMVASQTPSSPMDPVKVQWWFCRNDDLECVIHLNPEILAATSLMFQGWNSSPGPSGGLRLCADSWTSSIKLQYRF